MKDTRFGCIYILFKVLLLTGAVWASPAYAEDTQPTGSIVAKIEPNRVENAALDIEFMNRTIFTIRSGGDGYTEEERKLSIESRIKTAMNRSLDDHIKLRPAEGGGQIVELNGFAVFQIRPTDLDPLSGETIIEVAKNASENLRTAVHEARLQSNSVVMLKGVGFVVLATLLFYCICSLIVRVEAGLSRRLQNWSKLRKYKLAAIIQPQQLSAILDFLVGFVKWTFVVIASYEWVSFSLSQFPYSRPWGEKLNGYLIGTIQSILSAIVNTLPGLLVIFFIVLLTRLTSKLLKAFFTRIENREISVAWISDDIARPTRKLTQTLLWLFAIAMAYPYFPGSDTEAFKGLSVLIGLMVSIGGSGVVGQAASGLIMIYSRVLREGEYVKINEIEGLVTRIGFFSTKLRTSSGEEVNVPNSLISSSTTINSSRLAEGTGLVLHTAVTIGYNTPWRQVHAMLLQAAEQTQGICAVPKPFVSQTALSDFYVEYRLCVQIERPEIRRISLTALHGNIQDIFNQYGVQIMSPHYVYDPEGKVWVPKEQWFEAPAKVPQNQSLK